MQRTIKHDRLLTSAEVAKRLKVSERTVRYWIQHSMLTHISLPTHTQRPMYRIWESDIERMAEKSAV